MDENSPYRIRIDRPVYEHNELREKFDYNKNKTNWLKSRLNSCNVKSTILKTLPAIKWLGNYKWKSDLIPDLISGFTVAIMHIPQGMAYALLGNVPPVIGIYMAFFPVIIYFLFGTSKHVSMGTFAVVCLMTGKVVLEYSDQSYFSESLNTNAEVSTYTYTPTEVATIVTFTVGLFHLAMYVLRLGAASALLSETLVSGLTTGAAFQVATSQIKDLFGISVPKEKGYFVVINTLRSVFSEITQTNFAALIISAITIIIIAINNELLKPIVAKKSPFPVPIEFIAIVIGTLISKYCNLSDNYSISVIGDIPTGLPLPTAPPFGLFSSVILDSFSIALISYTITLSMGLMFAQKLNYEVDPNQELLALGMGNTFGSFFSCMPFCASLSRSLIQQTVGGKTQIASIVSCVILLVILLWIGPFFEPLPKSVLAGIIVISLKGMLMKVTEFWKFWKMSKLDACVWLITFVTVIVVSIDIGLLTGVCMSLLTIFVLNFKPYTCLLGSVPGTDIYMDTSRYKAATEIAGIKIFHYRGGLNFASKNLFKSELLRLLEINPQKEIIYKRKLAKLLDDNKDPTLNDRINKLQDRINTTLRCVILDFSSLSYIDPSGVNMLQLLIESFQKIDIPIYIAACSEPIYEMLSRCGLISNSKKNNVRLFATVHDAVESASEIFQVSPNVSMIS